MSGSQTEWVLQRLRNNPAPLTPQEALREAGIMRLAARVHELRQRGLGVVREAVEVTTRDGGQALVAGYRLAGGERGGAAA